MSRLAPRGQPELVLLASVVAKGRTRGAPATASSISLIGTSTLRRSAVTAAALSPRTAPPRSCIRGPRHSNRTGRATARSHLPGRDMWRRGTQKAGHSPDSTLTGQDGLWGPKPSKLAMPVRSRSPAPRITAGQAAC
jgi:hypothetical protein